MRNHDEPSVEEILDSIKKVIARDSQSVAPPQGERRDPPSSDPVLELGKNPGDELVLPRNEARPAREDGLSAEGHFDTEPGLIADATRSAMEQNFAALDLLAKPGAQPQIVRQGETSLEGLVRELLKPMLTQWLDRNLPGMVEAMVKAEIARIAGKKR